MRTLSLVSVLVCACAVQAQFIIEVPLTALSEGVGPQHVSAWASFGTGAPDDTYLGYPVGPLGDPPAILVVFYDHGGENFLVEPWASYPFIENGELSICGTTRHIGSQVQMYMMWQGHYVLSSPWPECDAVELDPLRPAQAELLRASPNPFNPDTRLSYRLKAPGSVSLEVWDLTGRRVARLVEGEQSAGQHEVRFDASRLASGLYLALLETPEGRASCKLLLGK